MKIVFYLILSLTLSASTLVQKNQKEFIYFNNHDDSILGKFSQGKTNNSNVKLEITNYYPKENITGYKLNNLSTRSQKIKSIELVSSSQSKDLVREITISSLRQDLMDGKFSPDESSEASNFYFAYILNKTETDLFVDKLVFADQKSREMYSYSGKFVIGWDEKLEKFAFYGTKPSFLQGNLSPLIRKLVKRGEFLIFFIPKPKCEKRANTYATAYGARVLIKNNVKVYSFAYLNYDELC